MIALLLACALFTVSVLLRPASATRLWVLVLSTAPILRVMFGSIPIYAIDVLVIGALVGLAERGAVRGTWQGLPRNVRQLIAAYCASLTIPLVLQVGRMPFGVEALYGFGREVTAFSAVLVGVFLGRSAFGTKSVLRCLTAGGAVGGALAIAQRVPLLSSIVGETLRSIAPGIASGAARTYPGRSTAFMSAPTTLSGFLCIVLLLLLFSSHHRRSSFHMLAVVLVIGGLLSTYSRQWLPAFVVGLVVALWPGYRSAMRRSRRMIMAGLLASTVIFTVGPLDVNYLFDRVTATGADDANVATRLERQRRFAGTLVQQPLTFVAGEGFALQDIGERQGPEGVSVEGGRRLGYTDNSFLLEFANRGLLAAGLYMAILFVSLRRTARLRGVIRPTPELVSLTAGLSAAVVLHLFDNYFSEAMFMRMTLWLLVGLIHGSADRLVRSHSSERRARTSANHSPEFTWGSP